MVKATSIDTETLLSSYDPEPFFDMLDLFFEQDKRQPARHLIDSMDQFIEEIIPSIVQGGDNIISEKITGNKLVRNRLVFENLKIESPTDSNGELLFPLDALQRKISYASYYSATVTQFEDVVDIDSGKKTTRIVGGPIENTNFAKVFIMVGSKYCSLVRHPDKIGKHCKYDNGGYFIVNGGEKVVVTMSSTIPRKPMVIIKKEQSATSYTCVSNSRHSDVHVGSLQRFTIKLKKDGSIVTELNKFNEISIFAMIRALGLVTDRDIVDIIADREKDNELVNQLMVAMNAQNNAVMDREQAIKYLTTQLKTTRNYTETDPEARERQKRMYLFKVLAKETLPHVVSGTDNEDLDMYYKAYFICYMIRRLLKAYLRRNEDEDLKGADDRDSEFNKRLEPAGILLATLFEKDFKKTLREYQKTFTGKRGKKEKSPNVTTNIKPSTIEQGQRQALSIGNFGSKSKTGLSMLLNRMNHLHTLSYLRRVVTPTSDASTNKLTKPRQLHVTKYGSDCPFETPSSANTGLSNNMTITEYITTNMINQSRLIMSYFKDKITLLESVEKKNVHRWTKVFLNNAWIGNTNNAIAIANELREMRFRGDIHKFVGMTMYYRENEFHVRTDGGRRIRPYLTVTDNKLNFDPKMLDNVKSWGELMIKYPRVIEYVDKEEEQNMMLAVTPNYIENSRRIQQKSGGKDNKTIFKINQTNRYDGNVYCSYTHCEIHPCVILGSISSNISFLGNIQAPRGMYQYNQARYAMGLYISDFKERFDNSYILYHPQIPIVSSRAARYTGSQVFPAGENVIVAIASYTGYNQEDSIILNGSAVEKGLFRATALKKYIEQVEKNPSSSQTDVFMKPDPNRVSGMKSKANYDKLSEEGYVPVETVIENGDVIIGLVNPKPVVGDRGHPYSDNSVIFKSMDKGAVDRILMGTNSDGYPIIMMRVRSEKIPEIGDKFASRNGQKGVVGYRAKRVDLPFSKSGLIPDITLNPNAFPKRMTIGQFIECMLSKVCCLKGITGDATPFMGTDINKINDDLVALGYEDWGYETMYNGMTGEKMDTRIFIGPTYYQRLKQMVKDKAFARAGGPVELLTRQPTAGKARGGGLRLGEMERDAVIAHGASMMLRDRLMESSDIHEMYVCDLCGMIAHKNKNTRSAYVCTACNNSSQISKVVVPYALKLLHQEMLSMNIRTNIRTAQSIVQ